MRARIAIALFSFIPRILCAHHSRSDYDTSEFVEMEGGAIRESSFVSIVYDGGSKVSSLGHASRISSRVVLSGKNSSNSTGGEVQKKHEQACLYLPIILSTVL